MTNECVCYGVILRLKDSDKRCSSVGVRIQVPTPPDERKTLRFNATERSLGLEKTGAKGKRRGTEAGGKQHALNACALRAVKDCDHRPQRWRQVPNGDSPAPRLNHV